MIYDGFMITSEQVLAARGLIKWSQKTLVKKSEICLNVIIDLEADRGGRQMRTMVAIQQALEKAGVVFIDKDETGGPGVRLAE